MSETKIKLVEAATNMFSRYGVKRTSMAAIADEAGVSRQTLYATFSSKEDLLASAMQSVIADIISALEKDWQQCNSLEEVLTTYFKHAVYQPFEIMKDLPDLKDLLHGIDEATTKVVKETKAEKTKILAKQLLPYKDQFEANGTNATSVANFIVTTTTELKYSATSRRELDNLLKTLKLAILAMLNK